MPARLIIFAFVFTLLLPLAAHAAAGNAIAFAKPGGGQLGLAVGFTPEGQLRAGLCASAPCSLEHAQSIDVPEAAAKQASLGRLTVVRIGTDRKGVVVEIPDAKTGRKWAAILLGPVNGAVPLVPFSGYVGLTEGTEDEPSGPMILVRDGAVYVGTQRAGYDLCGRPAMLAPEVLDPVSLTLKPAKLQRLEDAERESAPVLTAKPAEGGPPPALLHATWATSAAPGAPASALTDGNAESFWSEDRGGAGRGELVVLSAPRAVPLGAFEIALPARSAPHAAVPRDVFLVTEHQVFRVDIPDPGATGARFEVSLPSPVSTGCVALVLDGASSDAPDAAVSVAEVAARPALAGSTDDLVHALAGGGADAEAAGAVLRASGADALSRVAAAFATLDEGGRRVALDVLDDAPCAIATPVYVSALISPIDAQRLHARRAIERCPADTAAAFAAAIGSGTTKDRVALADELSGASPSTAVAVLVPLLAHANVVERRAYRAAIGRAALADEAHARVVAALDDPKLAAKAVLDLLRALDGNAAAFGDPARRAFARTLASKPSFRTQYLLLGPAAELASIDGGARAFIQGALTTERDPRIVAEAARGLRDPLLFRGELSRLLDHPSVRVREAAIGALGAARAEDARDRMLYVMAHDEWPLVRAAAARAVVGLAKGKPVDPALAEAVEDQSDDVRRAAIRALGARGAVTQVAVVRERFEDDEELPAVRAEAAISLGLLCDARSLPKLTEDSAKLASMTADDVDRLLGQSALAALALIHPGDLEKRLSPLRSKNAPPAVKLLAQRAARTAGHCSRPMPVPVR